jgi:hypothetical protein
MKPGQWYGRADLVALAEVEGNAHSARAIVNQQLMRRGLVERAQNPAPCLYGVMAGREPVWLYRLSSKGVAHRRQLMKWKRERRMEPLPVVRAADGTLRAG